MEFVKLIKERYVDSFNAPLSSGVSVIVNKVPQMEELSVVSLKQMQLSTAGTQGEISRSCPNIRELDISYTRVSEWAEVVQICRELSKLEYLDISGLEFPQVTCEETFPSVRTLVVEGLRVSESGMKAISASFPNVTNLVNRRTVQDFSGIFRDSFRNVVKLNLAYCSIFEFSQLEAVGSLENLEWLKLCYNLLVSIGENQTGFPKLRKLNLEETKVHSLVSLKNLNTFPELNEVRMRSTPLAERFGDHFRKMMVAYLPKVSIVNGGKVSEKEREKEERQFVRDFSDPNEQSSYVCVEESDIQLLVLPEEKDVNVGVFEVLYGKHGVVHKFAEVDLSLPKEALVHFKTEEGQQESHTVPLHWQVKNLKMLVKGIFGIEIKDQKLFYGDHEVMQGLGLEPLRFDNVPLSRLGFKDNDEVLVRKKD